MKLLHLDFHGRLSVTVEVKEVRYLPARAIIAKTYASFVRPVPSGASASLVIGLGGFEPDLAGRHVVDGKFHLDRRRLFCAYRHKIARWEVEVTGLESEATRLDISGNVFSYLVFPFESVHQMIFLKLGRLGLAPIHALGVSKEGKARLLIGRSGVGKSLLGGKFLRDGFALLGDDTVLLDAGGTVHGFPLPIGMRSLASSLLDYGLRLSWADRMVFGLTRTIRWLTLGRIGLLFKISPTRLMPERLARQASLQTAFFAVPGEPFGISDPGDMERFLDRVMINVRFEAVLMTKMLDAFAYIHPDSELARHWDHQRGIFREAFSRARLHLATLPARLPEGVYESMKGGLHG